MIAGQDFLEITQFSKEEVLRLLALAVRLKSERKAAVLTPYLKDKNLVMIFEKPSNRTRLSFEIGMGELGGRSVYVAGQDLQLGVREPVCDAARVISRYADLVMLRVFSHQDLLAFADHADVPVINGLTDWNHPCQAMADALTILENKNRLDGIKICYVGDGNNVCRSLAFLARVLDMELVLSCPKGYESDLGTDPGIRIERDPVAAARNADVVYTDVWTSMGQEEQRRERLRDFSGYSVNAQVMAAAKKDAIFMHCLPAHRGEEVSADVLESAQSVVFDQAENRLHAQKAIMAALMGALQ